MTIFHTSNIEIPLPDIYHSRDGLDFGKGFYCTILKTQAMDYGKRFSLRNQPAILNKYILDDNYTNSSYKKFQEYNEEWLDFIMACRQGAIVEDYDIIEGGVADDKIFRTIDLYFSGDISRDDALKRLKYEQPNHQICFRNQSCIDRYLKFISSERL